MNEFHPCGFILNYHRTKSTNKKMLLQLKQSSSVNLQSSHVFVDFEQGAIRAFKECFPGEIVKASHFLFTQCLWSKIKDRGLSSAYKDKIIRV